MKYLRFILLSITIFVITGCSYNNQDFTVCNPDTNQVKHYCMIGDKHYFDLNVMSENGTMNKIAGNIPYGNPWNANIYSIATDGEYLYCHTFNLQTKEDIAHERKLGLYKIDVENNIITPLHEWEFPKNGSINHYSITFEGEYVYFFISNGTANDICRIKKDGTEFEQLTNNQGSVYSGLFFVDGNVYYHKDNNLYITTLDNLDSGELFYENLYTIELYNGYFYCTTYDDNKEFIRIKTDDPKNVEVLIDDMHADCYMIKNDVIYYAKYDPIVLVTNSQGLQMINPTQGQLYSYDLKTNKNKKIFQHSEMSFNRLYNISGDSIIVEANTNTQLIASAEGNGVSIEYYIIPLDGGEVNLIKDLTLSLQGT